MSAAWFYQRALGPQARILVIDNHDDFGGHAKRNEFWHGKRMLLSYGGTMSIESPFPYSFVAKSLLAELGIRLPAAQAENQPGQKAGADRGVFFDRDHFAADRIVKGYNKAAGADFWRQSPLSAQARAGLERLHAPNINFLPDMTPAERRRLLESISYETFLRKYAGLNAQALSFFDGRGYRNNMRIDTCPAFIAMRSGAPGFSGMDVEQDPVIESEIFHFPDGNASIARLLVSQLVPGVFNGPQDMNSIVSAKADYSQLDQAHNPVKIRLGQMVVRVEHTADPDKKTADPETLFPVRVVYQKPDGSDLTRHSVLAKNVILACFNNIIPYIVPQLPEEQKQALKYPSKVPMMYTSVVLKNWRPWQELKINSLHVPHGYYQNLYLETPARFNAFETVGTPDEPVVLHMLRNPNFPGHPRKEQNRLGRHEMLETPFEDIEARTQEQLQRMFHPYGFDAQEDILAITVNRWPHGYAYTYDTLGDPRFTESTYPHVIGRRPFGRIAIANADSGASAFTNVAIDEAEPAVQDCLHSRGYR